MIKSDNVMSVTDVRTVLRDIENVLTTFNTHILDNTIDCYDYDNIRKAWLWCRDISASKWTSDIF